MLVYLGSAISFIQSGRLQWINETKYISTLNCKKILSGLCTVALGYDVVYTLPKYQWKYRTKTTEKCMLLAVNKHNICNIYRKDRGKRGKQSKLYTEHIHYLYLAQNISTIITSRWKKWSWCQRNGRDKISKNRTQAMD